MNINNIELKDLLCKLVLLGFQPKYGVNIYTYKRMDISFQSSNEAFIYIDNKNLNDSDNITTPISKILQIVINNIDNINIKNTTGNIIYKSHFL